MMATEWTPRPLGMHFVLEGAHALTIAPGWGAMAWACRMRPLAKRGVLRYLVGANQGESTIPTWILMRSPPEKWSAYLYLGGRPCPRVWMVLIRLPGHSLSGVGAIG